MSLNLKWQRLLVEGDTCQRCESTEEEIGQAFKELNEALRSLGIDVELEKKKLSQEEFKKNPQDSNMIFINGKPLENWVDAETGKSECCGACGDEDCRTIIVNGKEYEVVPSELIIEAGLKAASEEVNSSCCSSGNSDSCCCSC